MPRINLKLSVLDTLFILVSSFTIFLFIMWIAGQIIGTNQFEHLPGWTSGMMDKVWGFLTTGAASALLYWLNRNKRSVPNYLVWILGTTLIIAVLTIVAVKMVPKNVVVDEVKEAKLHFRLEYQNSPKSLAYIQQAPIWKEGSRSIMIQSTGYFQEFVDLPGVGEKFVAKLTPLVTESAFSDSAMQLPLELCFTRKDKKLPTDRILAVLKCTPSKVFEVEDADPGCIELCGQSNKGPTVSFSLFSSCYGQSVTGVSSTRGWAVPNLNTLLTEKKTGFTQVDINSSQLASQLAQANRYTYAIRVNGFPIYIDGFHPNDMMQSFKYNEGLTLKFGLQNLGFSGKNDGFEKIEILLTFYNGEKQIAQSLCTLDYVALRSSDPKEISGSDGSRFTWQANYKLPAGGFEYEVFNISSTDVREIRASKSKIDAAGLSYDGRRIVGVIRPPLPPNKNYGVILGLELPNKQIRFLYSLDEAKKMIQWTKEQPGNNFSRSIYLYRITDKQRIPNDG